MSSEWFAVPGYSVLVEEHFRSPRNVGRLLAAPNVITTRAGERTAGLLIELGISIQAGRVGECRYQIFGCPHSIAAASWLSERLLGATVEELEQWNWREVEQALSTPLLKRGRLLILEDAIRALARMWRERDYNSS